MRMASCGRGVSARHGGRVHKRTASRGHGGRVRASTASWGRGVSGDHGVAEVMGLAKGCWVVNDIREKKKEEEKIGEEEEEGKKK